MKKTSQPGLQLVPPTELWIKPKAGDTDLQRTQLMLVRPSPTFYRDQVSALSLYPYAHPLMLRRKTTILPLLKDFRESPVLARAVCEQYVVPRGSLQVGLCPWVITKGQDGLL